MGYPKKVKVWFTIGLVVVGVSLALVKFVVAVSVIVMLAAVFGGLALLGRVSGLRWFSIAASVVFATWLVVSFLAPNVVARIEAAWQFTAIGAHRAKVDGLPAGTVACSPNAGG